MLGGYKGGLVYLCFFLLKKFPFQLMQSESLRSYEWVGRLVVVYFAFTLLVNLIKRFVLLVVKL